MPRYKDLTGQRFGRLTVIEYTPQRKDNCVVWKCQCDCGNITYINSHQLRRGTQSCGCLQRETVSKMKAKDIQGQQFGKLTAIEPTQEKKHGSIIWHCKCQCGNDCYIPAESLLSGNTKSCGCLHSLGNATISTLLSALEYNFCPEYKVFINGVRYSFDFAILNDDNTIKCIIEYDGILHFQQDNFHGWNTPETWEKTQYNDDIKNQWCEKNSIKLIRIPYTDFKKLNILYLKGLIENV